MNIKGFYHDHNGVLQHCLLKKREMVNRFFVFLPLFGACFKGYHWPLLFSLDMKSSVNVRTWESALTVLLYKLYQTCHCLSLSFGN